MVTPLAQAVEQYGDGVVLDRRSVSANNSSTATTTVNPLPTNHPPTCGGVSADPAMLWPPNHDLRLVTLSGGSDPDGDPVTITITGVTSNEACRKHGPDWPSPPVDPV